MYKATARKRVKNRTISNKYKHYDVIISINVHEKFEFLLKQLDNISTQVHCNYSIILNCNDYMFAECKKNKLSENVYVHPTILNKRRFHGSITNGICNNMNYAIKHFTFDFFIVASSRNMFENNLTLNDLNHLQNKRYTVAWELKKNTWHWPNIINTHFLNYMLTNDKKLYKSPHEGLVFKYNGVIKILKFLLDNDKIKNELFQIYSCCEEYALQTIVKSKNENFYDIGNGTLNEKNGPNINGRLKFMYKIHR
jgi:hypothetical protein